MLHKLEQHGEPNLFFLITAEWFIFRIIVIKKAVRTLGKNVKTCTTESAHKC